MKYFLLDGTCLIAYNTYDEAKDALFELLDSYERNYGGTEFLWYEDGDTVEATICGCTRLLTIIAEQDIINPYIKY